MTNATDHDDFGGLHRDLGAVIGRRTLLAAGLGGLGAVALAACGSSSDNASSTAAGSGSASSAPATTNAATATSATATPAASAASAVAGDLTETPSETGGPYPGDGTNGPNVLTESGVVRQDIRSSFGSFSGTAEGIPLTITLTVVDGSTGAPVSNAAVYLWHCDRDGNYSIYSNAATNQNYLRGVQQTAADGTLSFTSIFPGCYSGRWPHAHFEVFGSVDDATTGRNAQLTSQIAFPKDTCEVAYASSGYETSISNLGRISLASDNVFGDDLAVHELATMSGDASAGYTAALTVVL